MGRFFDRDRLDRRVDDEVMKVYADLDPNTAAKVAGNPALQQYAVLMRFAMLNTSAYANEIAVRTLELTDALEKRIAELEKQPFAYDGPHETGKTYGKGIFVTHDGSLWHCNYKTASRPGDGPAWTLSVKRGRDAK